MGGMRKVVARVPCCDKGRSLALSIAIQTVARVPGSSSVSLEGDRVVVIGEDIDSCRLMKSLQKKVGCVELVTVGPVEKKEPPPKPAKQGDEATKPPIECVPCLCRSVPCFCQTVPRLWPQEHAIYICECKLCNPEPICVIM